MELVYCLSLLNTVIFYSLTIRIGQNEPRESRGTKTIGRDDRQTAKAINGQRTRVGGKRMCIKKATR